MHMDGMTTVTSEFLQLGGNNKLERGTGIKPPKESPLKKGLSALFAYLVIKLR